MGFWPAVIVLGFYTIEPNLLAHTRLVTTDFGLTCFSFGTLYFLWRTTRRLSVANLGGLSLFFALSQISKFSALLLGPIVLTLLMVRSCQKKKWPTEVGRRKELPAFAAKLAAALAIVTLLAVVSWLAVWAIYDFRYLPSGNPEWRWNFQQDPGMLERAPLITKAVAWSEAHHFLPNAYTQGFLLGQVKAQKRAGFLAGSYSTKGWWYFFPLALLIKTPISLIVLFLTGLALCAVHWRRVLDHDSYALLPLAAFLGAAMLMNLNIGVRHVLPIQPFILLDGRNRDRKPCHRETPTAARATGGTLLFGCR